MSAAATTPLIETRSLVKKFGSFTALNGVSLKVYSGEVHALLGDNGAGKSTKVVSFASPRNATDAGIGTVYQDLALNPLTSVTRNFFLGRELTRFKSPFGLLKMNEMHEIAMQEMKKIGITISDPEQAVGTMSGGQRQTLAIARAIYFGAKVLILDEPTSALGQKQQMEVLKTIRRVQQLGNIAIILITHNEIHARLIADRFTFLSLGEVIGEGTAKDLEGDDIKRLMAGGAKIGDLAKELAV
ncbi:MAG: sugar ABC transporter ATP-binding protein [Proteobacteria bacterium]|nr:sugar ABC transporter ATP-binding protein [Pseudomonadota bacterium]